MPISRRSAPAPYKPLPRVKPRFVVGVISNDMGMPRVPEHTDEQHLRFHIRYHQKLLAAWYMHRDLNPEYYGRLIKHSSDKIALYRAGIWELRRNGLSKAE